MTAKSRSADKFVVRLPEGLRDVIAAKAKQEHRSMNSSIISVLEKAYLNPLDEKFQSLNTAVEDTPTWIPTIGQLVLYKGEYAAIEEFNMETGRLMVILDRLTTDSGRMVELGDLHPVIIR